MQLQRQNVEGRDPVDEARFVKAKASKLVCECSARRHNTQSAKYAIAICNSRAWRYEDIAFTIVVRNLSRAARVRCRFRGDRTHGQTPHGSRQQPKAAVTTRARQLGLPPNTWATPHGSRQQPKAAVTTRARQLGLPSTHAATTTASLWRRLHLKGLHPCWWVVTWATSGRWYGTLASGL